MNHSTSPRVATEPRVIIKPRRARPLFARHPWVFAGSIERVQGNPDDGAEVTVWTHQGEFIARGLYNSQSLIRVRLYSWEPDRTLDESFWRSRLEDALRLRRQVLQCDDPDGACRLVFSESDGLSGLIVDRYGSWLSVQVTSLALAQRLETLQSHLVELCRPQGIYLRTERGVGEAEGLKIADRLLWGEVPDSPIAIVENQLEFEVDLKTGQKTGFYLDQRENRRAVAALACGRRVLDMFCYTGGFALAAARAGAASVVGVDASSAAIELAQRNAHRNRLNQINFRVGQAFETMQSWMDEQPRTQRFDMVILDPPKFARNARSVDQALHGYLRLNALGARLLEPDGILVTCSCAGHITRQDFLDVLAATAEQTGRSVQILSNLGQAADHPVSASCPESHYLQCMIARVI